VCGAAAAAAGWGRLQQQRPHRHASIKKTQVFKYSSAMPHLTSSKLLGAALLRLSRLTLEKRGQKGKFLAAEKFALLHIKTTKIHRI